MPTKHLRQGYFEAIEWKDRRLGIIQARAKEIARLKWFVAGGLVNQRQLLQG